jgi:hypothetical protein
MIEKIKTALASLSLPIAVDAYFGKATDFIVLTPLRKRHDDVADNEWSSTNKGADVNRYMTGEYDEAKPEATETLLKDAGFIIVDSFYFGYEQETDQHHYVITVEEKEFL